MQIFLKLLQHEKNFFPDVNQFIIVTIEPGVNIVHSFFINRWSDVKNENCRYKANIFSTTYIRELCSFVKNIWNTFHLPPSTQYVPINEFCQQKVVCNEQILTVIRMLFFPCFITFSTRLSLAAPYWVYSFKFDPFWFCLYYEFV